MVVRTRLVLLAAVLVVVALIVASRVGSPALTAAVFVLAVGTAGIIAGTYLRLRRQRKAREKAQILRRVAELEEQRTAARGRPGR
jgi:hypothetical protein